MLAANYGFSHFANGNISLSSNREKSSWRFSYNTRYEDDVINSTLNRKVHGTGYEVFQQMQSTRYTFNNNLSLGADFRINPRNRLSVDAKAIIPRLNIKQDLHNTFVDHEEFRHNDVTWNRKNIDWNAIDTHLVSQRILVTRSEINGKHLGSLQFRNRYGVNVSRVQRAGIQLVATPDLILRMGDRITVIGEADSIKHVADELGNAVKHLDEPNMVAIFLGIVLGLLLGCIPVHVGLSYPVRLGLAGGPIIMGILVGAYGPRFHMVAYTTTSANLMLRSLGLSMYLACLGLDAGQNFLSTVMQPAALGWIGYGMAFTMVPVIIMSIVAVRWMGKSFATTAGMLCGAMANPIALGFVNDIVPGNKPSVAYATVYPLSMFLRVIIAQLIVMLAMGA